MGLSFDLVRDFLDKSCSVETSGFGSKTTMAEGINTHVGLPGLEPGTSRLSGERSDHLSYRPNSAVMVAVVWVTVKI